MILALGTAFEGAMGWRVGWTRRGVVGLGMGGSDFRLLGSQLPDTYRVTTLKVLLLILV